VLRTDILLADAGYLRYSKAQLQKRNKDISHAAPI
jgi:hypothetical protein